MSTYFTTSATIPLLQPGLNEDKKSTAKQSSPNTLQEQVTRTLEPSWRILIPTRRPPPSGSSWPEPECSIGLACSPLGRNKCWEVVGPVREISHSIFRATKEILDQHAEFLHETEQIPFSIMFGMYMIGRSESKARPTLVLSCESKKPRQKAIKLVRDNGILREYPGVLLAECSQSPTTLGQVRPLGSLGAADTELVYFSPPSHKKVCGRAIYVMEMESHNTRNIAFKSISKKSTIGGFVRLESNQHDDIYCGLTVAHAFEDELEPRKPPTEFEFSFDGFNDEDETRADPGPILSEGKAEADTFPGKKEAHLSDFVNKPDEAQNFPKITSNGEDLGIGSSFASSLDGENPDLDWALIEIIRPYTKQANLISIDDATGNCLVYVERIATTLKNASVVAVTSSGIQSGILSGASTYYKSPYGNSFQEVWTVRFDGRLERGDSGCWVINPENGDLYGHIVAGCPESRIGYLIPATRIFNDIRRQIGGIVQLATRGSASSTQSTGEQLDDYWDPSRGYQQSSSLLGMNQTKDDVLQIFRMSESIFDRMTAEVNEEYLHLAFNPRNLKCFTDREPPYAWNEISDQAKYEAIMRVSNSGTQETLPYWEAGKPEGDCPNCLTRWFLYRKWRVECPNRVIRYGESNPTDLDYMFVANGSEIPLINSQVPKKGGKLVENLNLTDRLLGSTIPPYIFGKSDRKDCIEEGSDGTLRHIQSDRRFLGGCGRRRPPSELSTVEEGSIHE